jgi:hypothetical protein
MMYSQVVKSQFNLNVRARFDAGVVSVDVAGVSGWQTVGGFSLVGTPTALLLRTDGQDHWILEEDSTGSLVSHTSYNRGVSWS